MTSSSFIRRQNILIRTTCYGVILTQPVHALEWHVMQCPFVATPPPDDELE
jgi:hypothetical protein